MNGFKFIPLLRLRECLASRCRKCKSNIALRTALATLAANSKNTRKNRIFPMKYKYISEKG